MTLTINTPSGSSSTYGGLIADAVNGGTSTQILSGANTYTGGTVINGGKLEITAANALNTSGTVTINGSNSGFTGSILQLDGGLLMPSGLALVLNSNLAASARSSLVGNSGNNSSITLGGDYYDQAYVNGGTLNLAGAISGNGFTGSLVLRGTLSGIVSGNVNIPSANLLVVDGAAWTINSTSNNWAQTQIWNGRLIVGANNALATAATVALGASGTAGVLDLGGFNQQVGGLGVTGGAAASSQTIGSSGSAAVTLTVNTASGSTNSYLRQQFHGLVCLTRNPERHRRRHCKHSLSRSTASTLTARAITAQTPASPSTTG